MQEENLKARVAKLEEKFLAVMEELRRKDPERFEKMARTLIRQVEAFQAQANDRVQ